ncbi:hypothetical protein BLGI_3776 [Brevibacillus laterosporus GI-9]|nr:hypothetical protein BLGI_3776 [Brevibacillus laterosporus GI-9]
MQVTRIKTIITKIIVTITNIINTLITAIIMLNIHTLQDAVQPNMKWRQMN